ncbi:alpha/beta fold hydrolase [Aggregicoccus sp. 17bor-14]|uniref:alpha/beta fold hydrolase n=1 Tax=Myxococcaceae TaxID=31 RepID=UPI003519DC52
MSTPKGRLYARTWRPSEGERGAPVLLFHDSLGCVDLWREFPAALCAATQRRVIAYDRLGFGRSDPRHDVLPPSFIGDEASVLPVLSAGLGFEAFVAFGHSVGGGMAACCAARAPQQVQALVTEAAQAFVEERTLAGIRAARAELTQDPQLSRLAKYHGTKARWVLEAWTETWLSPAFAAWNLDEELGKVRCPVLAIHGDQDEFGSVQQPERIGARVRGPATVHVISGCGHVPHRTHSEEVLRQVRAFVDGVANTAGA